MRTPHFGAAMLTAMAFASPFASPLASQAASTMTTHPAFANAAEKRFSPEDSGFGISINLNERQHERNSVTLGVHLSRYPDLVVIPGYPVLYDPRLNANYFFYEGTFWVFEEDDWYRSDWYNGPWMRVGRDEVPVFLLRIPVRYYNRAPLYFHPWALEMAPRWSLRWGKSWERRHRGWDRWDQRRAPPPAPPPLYQQQFPRERYPTSPEVQQRLRERNYRYRPREPLTAPAPAPPQPRQTQPVPPRQVQPVAPRQVQPVPPRQAQPVAPRQIVPPLMSPRAQPPVQGPTPQAPQRRDLRRQDAPATPPPSTSPRPEDGKRERKDDRQPGSDVQTREKRQREQGTGRPRDEHVPGSPQGPGA